MLLGIKAEVGLLDYLVILCLIFFFFGGPLHCLLQQLHHFTFLLAVHKGSSFLPVFVLSFPFRLFSFSLSLLLSSLPFATPVGVTCFWL